MLRTINAYKKTNHCKHHRGNKKEKEMKTNIKSICTEINDWRDVEFALLAWRTTSVCWILIDSVVFFPLSYYLILKYFRS